MDLSNQDWVNELKDKIQDKQIDILIGGPPCQGFGLTGTRMIDDPRNKLYKAFFDGINIFNPKAVLIENVKGMSTLFRGEAKQSIMMELEKQGYQVSDNILNSAKYGVPQFRERLFILGIKGNEKPTFPLELINPEEYYIVKHIISDLPHLTDSLGNEKMNYEFQADNYFQRLMRYKSKLIHNHVATNHKSFVIETIKQVPDDGNYKDLQRVLAKIESLMKLGQDTIAKNHPVR